MPPDESKVQEPCSVHHQDDEAGSHTPVNAHSVRSGIEMSPAGWGQGMGHLVCVVGTTQDAGGLLPGG